VERYLQNLRNKRNIKVRDVEVEIKIRDLFFRLSPLVTEDDHFIFLHSTYQDYYLVVQLFFELEKVTIFQTNAIN
jgi:hypothetical protein